MNEKLLLDKLTYMNRQLGDRCKGNKIGYDNTLFILDWDDTLFPTTWTSKNKINLSNGSAREQYVIYFQELDRVLLNFLKTISQYGKFVIVTNAMPEWIRISSIVIPQTYNIVKTVNIVSARSLYSPITKNMMDWKKMAFQNIIKKEYKNKPLMNIISIGDAEYEHQALVALTQSNFDKIKYLKSFRLIRDPNHELLIDQLTVLTVSIQHMWNKPRQICKTFKATG